MKRKRITQASMIIVVFLLVFSFLSISAFNVTAYATDTNYNYISNTNINSNTNVNISKTSIMMKQTSVSLQYNMNVNVQQMKPKSKLDTAEKHTKATRDAIIAFNDNLPNLMNLINTAQAGGDVSNAELANSIVSTFSSIAACCGPYGAIASAITDVVQSIVGLIMGGEEGMSEMAKLEDNITLQFDEVKKELSNIEEQINDLSNQIDESTNKIISEVTSAIDDAEAKRKVRIFYLSDEGNFSYRQFKNYIYGENEVSNILKSQAYYSQLKDALMSETSLEQEIKRCYDELYSALYSIGAGDQSDMLIFYDTYLLAGENSQDKTIVQYYYDYVSANPELLDGITPEFAAIQFAHDLYQTAYMADQITMTCNSYQYIETYKTWFENPDDSFEDERYVYNRITNESISMQEINEVFDVIENRQAKLKIQMVRDLAYILNMKNSYLVENKSGDIFGIANTDDGTFGNVTSNNTIYLSKINNDICKLFGIDESLFSYQVSNTNNSDGKIFVDGSYPTITASMYYNGTEIYTIAFRINERTEFSGGSGSSIDPYIITNAEQFALIEKNLDKCFILADDITFDTTEDFTPFGHNVNADGSENDRAFTGTLDGNGFVLHNLKIVGGQNSGLFAKIGEGGIVSNLTLENSTVVSTADNAYEKNSYFNTGVIAGENRGTISNCTIKSCSINADISNETPNRNLYVNVGWVVGYNASKISDCVVDSSSIIAKTSHDIGGNDTITNKNNLFVGGVCGYNSGAISKVVVYANNIIQNARAEILSNANKDIYPYVEVQIGGLCGASSSLELIENVFANVQFGEYKAEGIQDPNGNSKYTIHQKHCVTKTNEYVNDFYAEEISLIKANAISDIIDQLPMNRDANNRYYNVEHKYTDANATKYDAGSTSFNTDGLKFFVNDKEIEYSIIGIYGFNTQNHSPFLNGDSFDETPIVTILFYANIDGHGVVLTEEIEISIGDNEIEDAEILGLQPMYEPNTFTLKGASIYLDYLVGEDTIEITDDNIGDFNVFGNLQSYGEQKVCVFYKDKMIEFTINVVCPTCYNEFEKGVTPIFSDEFLNSHYHINEELSKEPSCSDEIIVDAEGNKTSAGIGWIVYECDDCPNVKYFYLPKTEHEADYENAIVETAADCYTAGKYSDVKCKHCEKTLSEGEIIPKSEHVYKKENDKLHYCELCGAVENHQYKVSESIKKDGDNYKLIYTYTCITCNDESGNRYCHIKEDSNFITEQERELPTLMASDGYAINGGDEVVVYIQLVNSPGVYGGEFGIRYDPRLSLLSVEDGDMLLNTWVKESSEANYGYNFVFANASILSKEGNILKLIFKVPQNAKVGEKYNISLVYDVANFDVSDSGGFVVSINPTQTKQFITRDGTISIVEHLPGDVNGDDIVDLLDAILIAKYKSNPTKFPIKEEYLKYANVNLDLYENGTPKIDVGDVVVILQTLTGGYGTNLLNKDYLISLNTNGIDIEGIEEYLSVNDYGYIDYNGIGLKNIEAEGYKFLGWFTQMVGGEPINFGSTVKYMDSQRKQTLYAQWELNEIVFNGNGNTNTDVTMPNVSYDTINRNGETVIDNKFVKEYEIKFASPKFTEKSDNGQLVYELVGWKFNGIVYDKDFNLNELLVNEHNGKITFTAVWKAVDLKKPTFEEWGEIGYEAVFNWYGSSDCKESSKIELDSDIVNKAQLNNDGSYVLYAKFNPITYNITFNFNGGTALSGKTSIIGACTIEDQDYIDQLFQINGAVTRVGYNEYNSWKDGNDKLYGNKIPSIELIATYAKTNNVTLNIVWNPTLYSITYVDNGGILSSAPSEFTVENIPTLPEPSYVSDPEFNQFVGWYFDKYFTQEFDKNDLINNPKNITLYAKWSLADLRKDNASVPQTINVDSKYDRLVIDWSNQSTAWNLSNLNISGVNEVYIIGNENVSQYNIPKITISVPSGKSVVKVYIEEFNLLGQLLAGTNAMDLELNVDGNCSIKAPCDTDAVSGFVHTKVLGDGSISIQTMEGKRPFAVTTVDTSDVHAYQSITLTKAGLYSTTFSTDMYCEGTKMNKLTFTITGQLVKYNGQEYIMGDAYFAGAVGGTRFDDVQDIYFNNCDKSVLFGGMLNWATPDNDNNENGMAMYHGGRTNLTYYVEDPGKDFAGNEANWISITGMIIATGRSLQPNVEYPEIGTTTFTSSQMKTEGTDQGSVKFSVIGIKIQKNGEEYIYGYAYAEQNFKSRLNDTASFKLYGIDKEILQPGIMYWRGSANDNNEVGVASAESFNASTIIFATEDPGKDFAGNESNYIAIVGICVKTGNLLSNYYNPEVVETTITSTVKAEYSENYKATVSISVVGFETYLNGEAYVYGNGNYDSNGKLTGSRLNDSQYLILSQCNKQVIGSGALRWWSIYGDNNASGVAGWNGSVGTEIGYVAEDPGKDVAFNEEFHMDIVGLIIKK